MAEIQKHYLDGNGRHFVATFDAREKAENYVPPEGATELAPPPSEDHRWIDGQWQVPAPAVPTRQPENTQLSMRQLRLGLVEYDFGADFIPNVIDTINDAKERARALVWYEETKSGIEWNHPMTQALMQAAVLTNPNFTQQLARDMWMEASAYPA